MSDSGSLNPDDLDRFFSVERIASESDSLERLAELEGEHQAPPIGAGDVRVFEFMCDTVDHSILNLRRSREDLVELLKRRNAQLDVLADLVESSASKCDGIIAELRKREQSVDGHEKVCLARRMADWSGMKAILDVFASALRSNSNF